MIKVLKIIAVFMFPFLWVGIRSIFCSNGMDNLSGWYWGFFVLVVMYSFFSSYLEHE